MAESRGEVLLRDGYRPDIGRPHPWVYRTEIASIAGDAEPGGVVAVKDPRGRILGYGYLNPASMIAVRMLTGGPEPPSSDLLRRRLEAAAQLRARLFPGAQSYRLVHAEADGLPGLVLDRFGEVIVVQILTLGMERLFPRMLPHVQEITGCRTVYERSDVPVRALEGLPERTGLLAGPEPPDGVEIEEEGVRYVVDVRRGQKTGHFLDQRFNRLRAGLLARGGRVLDAFCHTGGFGLQAVRAGAREVLAVDSSREALAQAMYNARINGWADRMRWEHGNAFDVLRRLDREGERFDVVILDPPAFAKNKRALPGAYRGYKEINLRALRLLVPGGVLVTCSCSQAVSSTMFLQMLEDAARDVGCVLQVLWQAGASPDHPYVVGVPETEYLKCVAARVLPRP